MSLTVKNIPTGIDLELYNVRIRHTLYLRSKECKGNINLICAIQLLELDVHHQKIDKCKGICIKKNHQTPDIYIG